VVDITDDLDQFCGGGGDGLCSVFVPHATAGVAIMETGSGSEDDLVAALERLLPRDDRYRHRHGAPGHGADHLLPVLVSPSLVVPVIGGNTTTATVSVVEYHGREFAIGVTTPTGRSLHVRSDHAPLVGSVIELTADPARVLVFPADLIDPSRLSIEERELLEVRR